ncbi:hypothetical protein [Candidatus Enterococcus mansonii]|uniref:Uncharacterized protein n=1 Tax=Candidatus Enterococcus mansonii TaxID=1834181 RepID=A0A242CFW0_9ENTE|nr:hypothetical protein [Enterococcus sp. 4G2_DIV0659]OTO08810.1 hypothetical protein A5880_001810 [Enterococcus sp. 4G2_DIV0659]
MKINKLILKRIFFNFVLSYLPLIMYLVFLLIIPRNREFDPTAILFAAITSSISNIGGLSFRIDKTGELKAKPLPFLITIIFSPILILDFFEEFSFKYNTFLLLLAIVLCIINFVYQFFSEVEIHKKEINEEEMLAELKENAETLRMKSEKTTEVNVSGKNIKL